MSRRLDAEVVVPVAAPPEDVFALVTDLERVPEWMPETIAAVERDGDAFRYRTVSDLAGTWRWAELEPPSRARWTGPPVSFGPLASFRVGATFDIEPAPRGSLVRARLALHLGRALPLMSAVFAHHARDHWERDVARLAELAALTPPRVA
jgi:uncharacterized protein YndB with AHSA1/START domain